VAARGACATAILHRCRFGALVRNGKSKEGRGMFRSLHVCVVAFGAVLLSGCASTPPPPPVMRWTSNNHATQEKWLNDRNTCYNETQRRISGESLDLSGVKANSVDGPICLAFNACLAARGYVRSDTTGALTIPEGASVQCATPNT
jgi:hypothetical protein